jgi:tRNA splicing ligase
MTTHSRQSLTKSDSISQFSDLLERNRQVVLVLIGLPGCGKSTFARRVLESCPTWNSVNQDVYKSKSRTYEAAEVSLSNGYNLIIDRCNFDAHQRKSWIELAHQYQFPCVSLMLPHGDDLDFCTERAILRGADGVHAGDEDWVKICGAMKSQFFPPNRTHSPKEEFELILTANTQTELDEILELLKSKS